MAITNAVHLRPIFSTPLIAFSVRPEAIFSEAPLFTRSKERHYQRKYKGKIQKILQSGEWEEVLGNVQVTKLTCSSTDPRGVVVFWKLADESLKLDSHNQLFQMSRLNHIESVLVNSIHAIRQCLSRENQFSKVPGLTFVHDSEVSANPAGLHVDVSDSFESVEVKKPPSRVYGLPWEVYMTNLKQNLKRGCAGDSASLHGGEDYGHLSGSDQNSDRGQTSKWARMWREQNSAHLQARRERKRSHQLVGLWHLNKELEALNGDNED